MTSLEDCHCSHIQTAQNDSVNVPTPLKHEDDNINADLPPAIEIFASPSVVSEPHDSPSSPLKATSPVSENAERNIAANCSSMEPAIKGTQSFHQSETPSTNLIEKEMVIGTTSDFIMADGTEDIGSGTGKTKGKKNGGEKSRSRNKCM